MSAKKSSKKKIEKKKKKPVAAEVKSDGKVRIMLLGGAGAMGRITIRDFVETAPDNFEIVIADYNLAAAKETAKSFNNPRISAIQVDATRVKKTAKSMKGFFAVINSTSHHFNLPVMEACLKAGCHYIDLGGLFHWARKQLKLNDKFKKAGLTAVCGVGCAPGIVNVLARASADEMDEVHEIHIKLGSVDRTPMKVVSPLGTSYSIETILEEASLPAPVFTNGDWKFVEPMSGNDPVTYPAPVGVRRPALTIHSETATLPLSYKSKGIRECTFRIAFSDTLDEKLRFVRELGLISEKKIKVGKTKIVPKDILRVLLRALPRSEAAGPPDEYEIARVIVKGVKNGKPLTEELDCHCPGIPAWGYGVDVDTGCPPSIVAQMLARGEITERGALAAEQCIPAQPFFAELEKRGMKITRKTV